MAKQPMQLAHNNRRVVCLFACSSCGPSVASRVARTFVPFVLRVPGYSSQALHSFPADSEISSSLTCFSFPCLQAAQLAQLEQRLRGEQEQRARLQAALTAEQDKNRALQAQISSHGDKQVRC